MKIPSLILDLLHLVPNFNTKLCKTNYTLGSYMKIIWQVSLLSAFVCVSIIICIVVAQILCSPNMNVAYSF